jgi:hypothetical protein
MRQAFSFTRKAALSGGFPLRSSRGYFKVRKVDGQVMLTLPFASVA